MQDWFTETFGEDRVLSVPDRDAIEHAIEYETSIYAYDPDDAGYPWDSDPINELRDCYLSIAELLEEINNE